MSLPNAVFKALLAVGLVFGAGQLTAAEIKIANQDVGTGQGLDDPTPASPIGGNPGTTRGQQARIVLQFAADLWGAVLQSDVPINVSASFAKLSCDANSGVLGSAGTNSIFSFNAPAPAGALAGTWYHSSLFDALAGQDANPDAADIRARFNGALGFTGCLEGTAWYFGLDGNQPAGSINFLNVVLHEIGHGLGFSGFGNLQTGAALAGNDGVRRPDIYSSFVYDNTKEKGWYELTNAERVTSALNDGNLVFTGTNVKAEAPLALSYPLVLHVSAPSGVAGNYAFNPGSIGPSATPANFSGEAVVASGPSADGTTSNAEACAPITNAGAVSGRVALVDRGTCAFSDKVLNVQAAGAAAVLIVNNQAGTIIPGGDGAGINVPVGSVSQLDGAKLKANDAGLTLGLVFGDSLAGADAAGNVQLYAPTTLAQGSSFSHYDTRLTPNALMEYAISADLVGHLNLDLTPALFRDEGWKLNDGTQTLLGCGTGIPTWTPGGIVIGANVFANVKTLAGLAHTVIDYRQVVRNYADSMLDDGLITNGQSVSLGACLNDTQTLKQWKAWSQFASKEMSVGVTVSGQSASAGSSNIYTLEVPANALALSLRTFGGTGDVSIYVKRDEPATPSSFTWKSTHARTNSEAVAIARPAAGTYYVTVYGETDYSSLTVLGNFIQR